ncbi:MAG TPA: hypothetical protein ENK91_12230 [Bacteroidetes bacterium]|nr:hypothetical protein [Bacteroidota bacterium]
MASYTGIGILNAFSQEFKDKIPSELKILLTTLNITVKIVEKEGAGGATSNDGTITIPSDTGPGIIPMNSVEAYTTFHQYDKDGAMIRLYYYSYHFMI